MCLSRKDVDEPGDILIDIDDKTYYGKYEYLKSYYTNWNRITKRSRRAIIDTHAGSGNVRYNGKIVFGSPLIALLKTLSLSNNLKIILNELDRRRYETLCDLLAKKQNSGFRIFRRIRRQHEQDLLTGRWHSIEEKYKDRFPDNDFDPCPSGRREVFIKSRADVVTHLGDINVNIDTIINEDLKEYEVHHKDGSTEKRKYIAIFFVDPCGSLDWSVIEKIGNLANKKEGIELILNWSYEAIRRNNRSATFAELLHKIYGIPLDEIEKQFLGINTQEQYLSKFKSQLERFWIHINDLPVPRNLSVKPKKGDFRTYFLIHCTNNKSAVSLSDGKIEKIKKKGFRYNFEDLKDLAN